MRAGCGVGCLVASRSPHRCCQWHAVGGLLPQGTRLQREPAALQPAEVTAGCHGTPQASAALRLPGWHAPAAAGTGVHQQVQALRMCVCTYEPINPVAQLVPTARLVRLCVHYTDGTTVRHSRSAHAADICRGQASPAEPADLKSMVEQNLGRPLTLRAGGLCALRAVACCMAGTALCSVPLLRKGQEADYLGMHQISTPSSVL